MNKKFVKLEISKIGFIDSGYIRAFGYLKTEFFKTPKNLNSYIFAHAWVNDPTLSTLESYKGESKILGTSAQSKLNSSISEEHRLANWPLGASSLQRGTLFQKSEGLR